MPETIRSRTDLGVIWRRRRALVLSVVAVVLAGVISIAVFLPDRYRATVTFLVERQDIEESLMRPGTADDMDTRLQTVGQRILSRSRLEELIQRFDLYSKQRSAGIKLEGLIEQMRRDIRLAPKGGTDDATGSHLATVALALSYSGTQPKIVADVANALATSYVEDDVKSRQQQAADAAKFLKSQLDMAKAHFDQSGSAQARLLDRKRALMRPLGQMDPGTGPDSPSARLAKLRLELTELRTKYRDQHPEVLRAQDEIRSLERQLSGRPAPGPATLDSETTKRLRETLAGVDADLMSNDYDTAKERYLSLVKLYEEARLNDSMAQGQQGDQFRILDPAVVPEHPVAPNRILLIMAGLAMAGGLAVGSVALAERLDTSFHTIGDLREFTRVPVLTSIPRIATSTDGRRRRRRVVLSALATAAGLILVVGISYYLAAWFGPLILAVMGGKA